MSDINELNLGPRWYVAHTYSGYENKVKASIEKIVENRGLGHLIFDVKIPVELTVQANSKGEEKEVESKVFPCYVFIKMTMTDESWHAVRNITGVTGFVGPGSKPVPLTEAEVLSFNVEAPQAKSNSIKEGDHVVVTSGDFAGYNGVVSEINTDTGLVTVMVSTVRRSIPVMVDIKDIKISDN